MDEPKSPRYGIQRYFEKRSNNYDGTLIIVSHDRDFLQGLSEKVYEFKDQCIKEYLGDINEFLNAKKVMNFKQFELENKQIESSQKYKDSENKISYKERKKLDKDIKKTSNKVGKFERSLEALENELKALDAELTQPYRYKELSSQAGFFESYQEKQQQLAQYMSDWEQNLECLEELKANEILTDMHHKAGYVTQVILMLENLH